MDGVTVSRMKTNRKQRKQRSMTEPGDKNRSQTFQLRPSTDIERCLLFQRNGFIRMNKKYEFQHHNTSSKLMCTATQIHNQDKWALRTLSRINSCPIENRRCNLNETEHRQIEKKQTFSRNKTGKIPSPGGKIQLVVNPNITSLDTHLEQGFDAVPYHRQHFKMEEFGKLYEEEHINSTKHLAKKANQMKNLPEYVVPNRVKQKTNQETKQPHRLPPLNPRKNRPKSRYPKSKNTSLSASTFIDSSQKHQERANAMVTPSVTQKLLKASNDTDFITKDLDKEIGYLAIGKMKKYIYTTTGVQEVDLKIYSENPFHDTTNQETISNRNLLGAVIVDDNNEIVAQNNVHPPKEMDDSEETNVLRLSVIENRSSEEKQSIRVKNYENVICDTDGSKELVRRTAVCNNTELAFLKRTKTRTVKKHFVRKEGPLEPIQGKENPDATNTIYCRTGACDNTKTRALKNLSEPDGLPLESFIGNENPDTGNSFFCSNRLRPVSEKKTSSLKLLRNKGFQEEHLIPLKAYENAPSYDDLDGIAEGLNKVDTCRTNHALVASRRRAAVCDSNDSAFRQRVKTRALRKRFELSPEGSVEAFLGNKNENAPQKKTFSSTTHSRRVGVCDNTDEVLCGRMKLRTMKKRFGHTGEVGREEKALPTAKLETH